MTVSLSIKNVPGDLAEELRQQAARHHRSVQGESAAHPGVGPQASALPSRGTLASARSARVQDGRYRRRRHPKGSRPAVKRVVVDASALAAFVFQGT